MTTNVLDETGEVLIRGVGKMVDEIFCRFAQRQHVGTLVERTVVGVKDAALEGVDVEPANT